MATSIYNFDVTSPTYFITTAGAWNTNSEGYYYAVIPLEVGKVYKAALQNVTTLTRFRCCQASTDVIGSAELSLVGYTNSPEDGRYLSFVAEQPYLICYGGTANGGEVSLTSSSIPTLVGTKWKMHSDALWLNPSAYSYYCIDGAFYEGESLLTELSSDNNIFFSCNAFYQCFFGYGSALDSPSFNLYPAPMVDSSTAYWQVVTAYAIGSGFRMRDLTGTLYLEITGGEDATNSALIAWVYGAGELQGASEEETTPTGITYNGATTSLEAGQTATLACSGKKAITDILVSSHKALWVKYNGKKTAVGQGKTATLHCAGKKMRSDVIVETTDGFYTSSATETTSGTSLTASVDCQVGDLVVAAIATRDTLTLSDGWTLLSTSGINSTDTFGQRLSWAWKYAESTIESITVTQASAQRLYINMVALRGATGVTDNGYSYRNDTTSASMTVDKPDGLVLWGMTCPLWSTANPYGVWIASNNMPIVQLGTATQSRLGIGLDQSEDESVTFTSGASSSTMIVGCLSVQGMDYFY